MVMASGATSQYSFTPRSAYRFTFERPVALGGGVGADFDDEVGRALDVGGSDYVGPLQGYEQQIGLDDVGVREYDISRGGVYNSPDLSSLPQIVSRRVPNFMA